MGKTIRGEVFMRLILIVFSVVVIGLLGLGTFAENYNVHSPNECVSNINMEEKILFIVDLSNSMNDYMGDRTKIDIAVNALANITSRLNPKIKTGLRVYGHKFGFNPIFGCKASELVLPLRENNTANINSALSRMSAVGWTPITKSLKDAVNFDFAGVVGQKRIILLTDGGETCDESPCDYAIKLIQTRDDIKIDVIAFAINDPDADAQLKCTAVTTSGKIYRANTAADLANSLEQALNVTTDVQGTVIMKQH